ncbi:MAG: transcription elongation factor GreA [Candidatus Uhrbacteria bacterium]
MTDGNTYITVDGLGKLQGELLHLKSVRRREIADKIERAKELGDLSENAEYHEAKDEQAFIEGRILDLETAINSATIVSAPTDADRVNIGSCVELDCDGVERKYCIVGASEADPTQGRISNESPLGQALLGRTPGEEVSVVTPRGKRQYRLKRIS